MKMLHQIQLHQYPYDKNYGRIDGYIAILFFLYYCTVLYAFGHFNQQLESMLRFVPSTVLLQLLLSFIAVMFSMLPIWPLIRYRRQTEAAIGIRKKRNVRAVARGMVASIPFILLRLASGDGFNELSWSKLVIILLHYLIIIAFVEEVAFRGFIQPRLNALFHSRMIAVCVGAGLFSIMHIPFQYQYAGMTIVEFIRVDYIHLLMAFFMHIGFYAVYNWSGRNIVAPTVTHAIIDMIYKL